MVECTATFVLYLINYSMLKNIILLGYSGHSFVCIDIALMNNYFIKGYLDPLIKENNPYKIEYLGTDTYIKPNSNESFFITIGSNMIRNKLFNNFEDNLFINLIHKNSFISENAFITENSNVLVGCGVIVNSFSNVQKGVILNTGCIIEHECQINEFSHIAPGATLAGNVKVGKRTFIGANSVIREGVSIGNDVLIGAGSVVVNDIKDGSIVFGNPARLKTN